MNLDGGRDVKVFANDLSPVDKVFAVDVQFLAGACRFAVVDREGLSLRLFHVLEQSGDLLFVEVFDAVHADGTLKF